MQAYKNLLEDIMANGRQRDDRTGTGTTSVFARHIEFDLMDGFPLLTLKATPFTAVVAELVWFLEGSTSARRLNVLGSKIWDRWAIPEDTTMAVPLTIEQRCELLVKHLNIDRLITNATIDGSWAAAHPEVFDDNDIPETHRITNMIAGELGPIYGYQWRSWVGLNGDSDPVVIDQIANVVNSIKDNPWSRRHIVSAWNVAALPDESISPQANVEQGAMALAPCHVLFQFYVNTMTLCERIDTYNADPSNAGIRMAPVDGDTVHQMELLDRLDIPRESLSCQVYMRSVDVPVGLPFNIASYALLTHLVANACGLSVGRLAMSLGDVHVYSDQRNAVAEMLKRDVLPLPKLHLPRDITVFKHTVPTIVECLKDYKPHPTIVVPVAV